MLQALILQYRAVERRRRGEQKRVVMALSCTKVSSYYCPRKNERNREKTKEKKAV